MKPFTHFYAYVKLTAFDFEGLNASTKPSFITVKGIAPKAMPDHVAGFLLQRMAKRWYLRWPKGEHVKPIRPTL